MLRQKKAAGSDPPDGFSLPPRINPESRQRAAPSGEGSPIESDLPNPVNSRLSHGRDAS
jgi:hypothetical protein